MVKGFPMGENLHEGIITREYSPWENFLRQKISIGGGRRFPGNTFQTGGFTHPLKKQKELIKTSLS